MKTSLTLYVLLHALTSAEAQLPLVERLRERISERRANAGSAAAKPVEMSYGSDPLQKLDYWRPTAAGSPLVVFVHGGGWKRGDKNNATGPEKPAHYLAQGYGFASINYRLVPAATVEQQAQDVASALAFLIRQAESLGFDASRVVLMGHSAGAHLSALVGTDMQYLKKAELGPKSLRGIIPLDGACYDVPRQIAEGGDFMQDTYMQAFGSEKERQLALSPTHHATAPNAPAFLILHVQRVDGAAQSKALGEALTNAGTAAEVRGFEGRGLQGHTEINRRLGDPAYPATPVVDEWLKKVFEK
ncbi:MAG: alpha/beta hydrolase [Verrucomicrobiaceae bacterium]|nr:alpha/beta hydrolase [Verrucomicrobiaceae bacterium]